MSIKNTVIPGSLSWCLGAGERDAAVGVVGPLVHTFCPVMTHSSPSRWAVVRSDPRSLPASGLGEALTHRVTAQQRREGRGHELRTAESTTAGARTCGIE